MAISHLTAPIESLYTAHYGKTSINSLGIRINNSASWLDLLEAFTASESSFGTRIEYSRRHFISEETFAQSSKKFALKIPSFNRY